MKKLYAAIDLGGTKIYTVLANAGGNIIASIRHNTLAAAGPDTVIEQLVTSVSQALGQASCRASDLAGVGVCAAGFFDWQRRVLVNSPNMAGWRDVPLESELAHRLKVPVLVENDANAAALGEARRGAGLDAREMVFMTVSTGIGTGLILNGRIYRGARGFAGEAGHMVVKPEGPLCGCGRQGCLETVASGTAIGRAAVAAIHNGKPTMLTEMAVDGKVAAPQVFKAAELGDRIAQQILEEAIFYLGVGLTNIVNMLNPEVIVLGGGVAEAGDALFSPLRDIIAQSAIPPAASAVSLRKAALGVEAGVTGMLCLLREECNQKED